MTILSVPPRPLHHSQNAPSECWYGPVGSHAFRMARIGFDTFGRNDSRLDPFKRYVPYGHSFSRVFGEADHLACTTRR
jgi:hypothetical protein